MSTDLASLRQQADALRHARDWPAAAAAYAAVLQRTPEDPAALLHRARCLQAAGQAAPALALFREIAALRPRDAGAQRRLAEAAAGFGRHAEAEAALAAAVALEPGHDATWAEWLAALPRAAPPPAAIGVVLDLSDLATWIRRGRRAPSGIQRVQLELAHAALRGHAPPVLCAMPEAGGGWRRWPAALFQRIDHLMRLDADPVDPAWRDVAALLDDTLQEAPMSFAPGAVLCSLGGSWSQPDHLACLRAARAATGLRHVPLLHDCAPLAVPEHCAPATVTAYARWFANLALHADAVLTSSHATRDELRRLHATLLPALPLPGHAVLSLDATPRPPPREAPPAALPRALRGGRPFVLFVATIEARKNHLMVFQAWLALLRQLGPAAVPDLVCVGRPGWLAGPALELLENAAPLRGRVHLLHGVADRLLALLYRGCLFTLYNSHYEGWGLPVTESLAAGRPVLTPAHSALLEAGEHGATFFEGGSEPDLVAKLAMMITDAAFRAGAEAGIAAAPPRRDWAAVAAQLLEQAARLAAAAPPRPPLPLAPGTVAPFRRIDHPRPLPAMAVAEAARSGLHWHPLDPDAAWTRPGPARLRLPLPAALHGPLRLELTLGAPPRDQVVGLRLQRGAPPGDDAPVTEVVLPAGATQLVGLDVPAGPGAVELVLESATTASLPDGRRVGLALLAISVARVESMEDRLAVREARAFRVMAPVAE
jgi:glycosyltransferase involved in cell wall biosynthesis